MVPKCYVLFPWFRNSVLFTQFIIIIIIIMIVIIIYCTHCLPYLFSCLLKRTINF